MVEYDWVDSKIVGTSSTLKIKTAINVVCIMVSDPFEWLSFLVELEKRICSSFDDYVVPFHECLLTRIGLRLPFPEFEVAILIFTRIR